MSKKIRHRLLPTLAWAVLSAACLADLEPGSADAAAEDAAEDAADAGDPKDISPWEDLGAPDTPAADVVEQRPDVEDTNPAEDIQDSAEPPPVTYTVAIVSDLNSSYGSTSYRADVGAATNFITRDLKPDLVLSTGDMVAGQKAGLDYRAMWRAFHGVVTDPLSAADIAFAPTPGNHDASGYAAYADERDIYVDEWNQKRPTLDYVEDTYYPLRYAYRLGPALFISLDATTVGGLGQPQMQWLEDVLDDNADASVKVVYGHIPLWGFAQGRETEIIGDPTLETLLTTGGVDLFASGHHHAYYPGRRDELRLLSMDCLGSGPRKLIGEDATSARSLAVITYDRDGIHTVEAFEAPNFTTAIPRSSLPQWIDDGNAVITRD